MSARKKKASPKRLKQSNRAPASASAGLSRRKLWSFRLLLAVGFPAALLVMTELALRLAGFGYPTRFFLPSHQDGQKFWVQNNQFGWRFFGPAMARMPEPICLPQTKPSKTIRIIVFGESAAMGDPQPDFGLSRMLQAMLELRYPGTHFEVVNSAMVAIDSNVILPIARDCARAKADVWVIYMGNNEVVGPFGAGTVFGRQVPPLPLIRADLALKATRIGQLIDAIHSRIEKPPIDKSEWGGMEMFLNQQVRADDPRMSAVYDHFSRNLSEIVKTGRQSGAGIVVSTVGVNLRDCAPFASAHRPGLSELDKKKWEQLYQNGIAAQTAGSLEEAENWFDQAAQIDNQVAELRFRQGSCLFALDKITDARKQFIAACDLDTLRFRCDSRLNQLIRDEVSKNNDPGVVLADAEQALAEDSPDGLPGNDLFYEHVHLTFHGNYLLALALAPRVESLLAGKIAMPASGGNWPSETDCARRLAWSDWDKEKALADMYSRLLDPPFTAQINHDAQMKALGASLQDLTPALQPAGIQAAKALCENALAAEPDDPIIHAQLAELDQSSDDLAGAETNELRAVALLPSSSEDWSELGIIQAKEKKYEAAASAFRRAFTLDSQDVWALQNLAQSLRALGHRDEAIRDYREALAIKPRFGLAWVGLGQTFDEMGNHAEATNCYVKAVENPIERASELTTLARLCVSQGWRQAAATNYEQAIKLSPFDGSLDLEAGQNLATLGRRSEAEHYFSDAARLSPDSLQAHFLYGLELGEEGKPAEAAAQFREAVRIMPDLPEARLDWGISLAKSGNYSEALRQFDQVLTLDPSNQTALQYVKALRQKSPPAQPN